MLSAVTGLLAGNKIYLLVKTPKGEKAGLEERGYKPADKALFGIRIVLGKWE